MLALDEAMAEGRLEDAGEILGEFNAYAASAAVGTAGLTAGTADLLKRIGGLRATKGGAKLPPNKNGYTQADYDAYVARKEAAGETPRSPEDYIARREQLDQNRLDGARRQEEYRQEMADIYGEENVLTERYLRDADGNIVKDPDTGEARRLDCVVVDGQCGYAKEVTSPTASKVEQI